MARLHRLFIGPAEPGTRRVLEEERGHYLRDVLRLREGDALLLIDGEAHEYQGTVLACRAKHCEIAVGNIVRTARRGKRLHLAHAAIKVNLEGVLQQATELGITDFSVFAADRSNGPVRLRPERALRIVRGAAEQCGRITVPKLHFHEGLGEALGDIPEGHKLFADLEAEPLGTDELASDNDITIIIGPEGGWTERERAFAQREGCRIFGLGGLALRAPTAGIAALAAVRQVRGWLTVAD